LSGTGVDPSGETRLAGVIGWPVRHSRSPAIHNAAYRALGLDWRYVAFPVPPGAVPAALAGVRALGIEGLSVTMPHKGAAAAAVDRLSADAAALGAVNSVHRDGDLLVGDNTDGGGFVDSLLAEGVDPAGRRCVVLGAGGAARAVIRALARAGADEVVVINRDARRAAIAAALAGPQGRVGDASALEDADLLVQATPVGMGDDAALAIDPAPLPAHAVVADLVYHPRRTPLLGAAEDRGLRTVGGIGMLVHQAARQLEAWTGQRPPIDAMAAAVDA
jgi:shikimate dehydrogenase